MPVRKKVNILGFSCDMPWNFALIQTDWDKEDLFRRHTRSDVECILELALEVAAFGSGAAREATDEEVGKIDRALDCAGPVLPGQQLFAIHPGFESSFLKRGKQAPHFGSIFLGMSQEDLPTTARFEDHLARVIQLKSTQPVDLDGCALPQVTVDELQENLTAKPATHCFPFGGSGPATEDWVARGASDEVFFNSFKRR